MVMVLVYLYFTVCSRHFQTILRGHSNNRTTALLRMEPDLSCFKLLFDEALIHVFLFKVIFQHIKTR